MWKRAKKRAKPDSTRMPKYFPTIYYAQRDLSKKKTNLRYPPFKLLFREAEKDFPWSCVIFHDVDLLPQNETNTYRCSKVTSNYNVSGK